MNVPRRSAPVTLRAMSWWERLKSIAKREAGAMKEDLEKAAESLDEALAKKERELAATPAERVDMILDDIAEEDTQFGELEDRLRAKGVERATRAGIEPPVPPPAPPIRDLAGIHEALEVAAVETAIEPGDMTSHIVGFTDPLVEQLGTDGIDAVVADLQVDVMVLEASRRGDDVALRTPTLTNDAVADLVAAVVADHAPHLAEPPRVPTPPPADREDAETAADEEAEPDA